MKLPIKTLLTALTASVALSGSANAGLIAHYNGEEASGPLVDQVGGQTAAESAATSNFLYQQTSATAGTYGAVTLTSSLGNAVGIAANSGATWALDASESAELGSLTNNFTVMSWVFVPSGGIGDDWPRVIGDSNGGDGWNFGIRNKGANTNAIALVGNGISGYYSASDVIQNGTWQHIAATKSDTDGIKFYYNGNLLTGGSADGTFSLSDTADFTASSDPWNVGAGLPNNDQNINDLLMDELRVYDTVLTLSEIRAAAVPEPGSLALLGLGGLLIGARRRRD